MVYTVFGNSLSPTHPNHATVTRIFGRLAEENNLSEVDIAGSRSRAYDVASQRQERMISESEAIYQITELAHRAKVGGSR